jgi:hypothetical protein
MNIASQLQLGEFEVTHQATIVAFDLDYNSQISINDLSRFNTEHADSSFFSIVAITDNQEHTKSALHTQY